MPTTNGHGPKRAILYAPVSTDEQARSGFSLAQQLEALREYAAREGYDVLEEVSDPGQSGASLERPGMDRVRDLVAAGGVSAVLAQDRDRFSREPAYTYLLRREFAEHGCELRSLNDRGDGSPEGELTDGILDQLAKYERAKIAERARRGKLRKAREGKMLRTSRPDYGFKFDETGEAYVVYEEEMQVVQLIFRWVSEGQTMHHIKRKLELEGVPPPTNTNGRKGGVHWTQTFLRTLILDDVYCPHTYAEVETLVAPQVAARLDKSKCYGVFWFNRTRTTRKKISVAGPSGAGREYRTRHYVRQNPREQWVAIPVPDAGIPREVVDAAREIIRDNRAPSNAARRFWQIPVGAVCCEGCGMRMSRYAVPMRGRRYAYYKCSRLIRFGKDGCSPERLRTTHRAEEVERRVWEFVSYLMKEPEELGEDLQRMIELEKHGAHGDPERESKVWLDKLAEVDAERRGYLKLAARGSMTEAELDQALADLEETRATAERELTALHNRQEAIAKLERDKESLLEHYAAIAPEALDSLAPEERHQLYKMLRLDVVVRLDANLEVSGVFGEGLLVSNLELAPGFQEDLARHRI
jgi:site-specific DNA recombinase